MRARGGRAPARAAAPAPSAPAPSAPAAMAAADQMMYSEPLVKEVQSYIDEGLRSGQVSGAWYKIKSDFVRAKIGWYARVSPLKAAVSRRNRYGLGVTGSDAQAHGEQMISVGFHSVEDACAFEADPSDKEQDQFEEAFCKRSGGTIPPGEHLCGGGGEPYNSFLAPGHR